MALHVRLRVAIVLLVLLAAPLAGCLKTADERLLKSVKTRCDGLPSNLRGLPEPVPFESRPPRGGHVPPLQGTIRITLLLPAADGDESARGARLAAKELRAAGAPLALTEVPVAGSGHAAGLAAFRAAIAGTVPSLVVSALDSNTTDGMVDEAHRRRVPLLATAATSERLTGAHDGAGFFFRVPPSDAVEGRALAELVWSAGCRSANVIVGPTAKDEEVRVAFRAAFEGKGGAIGAIVRASNASEAVSKTEFLARPGKDEPRPEALVVLASPESSAAILRAAYERKVTARTVLFFAESALSPSFATAGGVDENGHVLAENLRGTSAMRADTPATEPVLRAYLTENGAPASNLSLRAYDAVQIGALAATCARSTDPTFVASKLPVVANADTGDTDVSGADPELALTLAGNCLVNYVGASHDHDWGPRGEPATGRFYLWTVASSGGLRVTLTRFEPPATART